MGVLVDRFEEHEGASVRCVISDVLLKFGCKALCAVLLSIPVARFSSLVGMITRSKSGVSFAHFGASAFLTSCRHPTSE